MPVAYIPLVIQISLKQIPTSGINGPKPMIVVTVFLKKYIKKLLYKSTITIQKFGFPLSQHT